MERIISTSTMRHRRQSHPCRKHQSPRPSLPPCQQQRSEPHPIGPCPIRRLLRCARCYLPPPPPCLRRQEVVFYVRTRSTGLRFPFNSAAVDEASALHIARVTPEGLASACDGTADVEPSALVRLTRDNIVGIASSSDGDHPATVVVVVPNGYSTFLGRYVNEGLEPTELLLNIRAAASQEPRPVHEVPRIVVPVKTLAHAATGQNGEGAHSWSHGGSNGLLNGGTERRAMTRPAVYPDERVAPLGWN